MAEEYFGFLAVTNAVSSSHVDRHASTLSADVSFLFSLLSLPLNLLFLPKTETFFFVFCLLPFYIIFCDSSPVFAVWIKAEIQRFGLLSPLSSPPTPPPSPPHSGSSQTISGLRKESVYSAAEACWNHAVFPLAETHCCHSTVCIFSCITRL